MDDHFKKNERHNIVIFKAENVLTPVIVRKVTTTSKWKCRCKWSYLNFLYLQMLELHEKVMNIQVDGKSFENICTR